jgi:hypothetical protein
MGQRPRNPLGVLGLSRSRTRSERFGTLVKSGNSGIGSLRSSRLRQPGLDWDAALNLVFAWRQFPEEMAENTVLAALTRLDYESGGVSRLVCVVLPTRLSHLPS